MASTVEKMTPFKPGEADLLGWQPPEHAYWMTRKEKIVGQIIINKGEAMSISTREPS
jgi:hypothetical protein